ncbi:ABC transporter permease [Herbidospora sp. NBRC 101105]|uniref:ABC transporter permease n=1 Tax=Herbidospora sp. NBRC 101105 TaxID=3032195 RepID=UPI0024A2C4BA|nr:ABC transporter permease [Herbidospora sp. NBRC 101105]GLX94129.1 hypothetical protein Hesp01_20790 [Herbidospora sp. NBRC 101105]
MWTWIRLDARRRLRPLVALALLVAVGSAAVTAAAAGARRGASAVDRLSAVTLPATVLVQPNQPGFDWDAVRRLPGVAAVATYLISDIRFEGLPDPGIQYVAPGGDLLHTVERAVVVAGRAADEDRADEAVVTTDFLTANGLRVGDVVVAGSARARHPVTIVGVVRYPFAVMVPAFTTTRAFAERHRADLEGTTGDAIHNAIVRLSGGPASIPEFQRAFAALTGRNDIEIRDLTRLLGKVDQANEFEAVILAALALAALVTGLALLGQAVARQAAGSAGDLRVLRTLGMRPRQALAAAVCGPASSVVAGALLGAGLAVAASPLFPIGSAASAEPAPGVYADLPVLAGVAGVVVAVLTVTAALAAWPSPGRDAAVARRSAVAAAAHRMGLPIPAVMGVRLALEPGTGRRPASVRPVLAGVVAGTAGVLAALTFQAGAADAVVAPSRFGQTFQLWAMTGFDGDEVIPADSVRAWAADPAVASATETTVGVVTVGSTPVTVFTRPGSLPLVAIEGRPPSGPGEIALAPDSARTIGAGVGDTLTVRAYAAADLTVTGIVFVPENPHNGYADGAWLSGDGYARLFPNGYFKFRETLLALRPGADPAEVSARLGAGTLPPMEPGALDRLRNVQALPPVLAGFLGLLAVGAVGHALGTAAGRRRHTVAVLRAIGMTPRQSAAMVFAQVGTLAAVGLLVGVPLGVAAGRAAWRAVAGLTPLLYVSPLAPLALGLAVPVALLAGGVLAAGPARRVARSRPGDVLRGE